MKHSNRLTKAWATISSEKANRLSYKKRYEVFNNCLLIFTSGDLHFIQYFFLTI